VLPSSGLVPPWLLNGNACITTTRLNVIWWGTFLFLSSGDNMAQSICSGNNMAPIPSLLAPRLMTHPLTPPQIKKRIRDRKTGGRRTDQTLMHAPNPNPTMLLQPEKPGQIERSWSNPTIDCRKNPRLGEINRELVQPEAGGIRKRRGIYCKLALRYLPTHDEINYVTYVATHT
jgi:hypothetical protein